MGVGKLKQLVEGIKENKGEKLLAEATPLRFQTDEELNDWLLSQRMYFDVSENFCTIDPDDGSIYQGADWD